MARFIRRRSMERLELYDLDQFGRIDRQIPPPLPPPRNPLHRRTSMNPSVERYQFLCNMTRNRTDPIYAATPMFTTIPQSPYQDFHRYILGSSVRSENVKPIFAETSVQSPELEKSEKIKETNEKENHTDIKEENPANHHDENQSSSSSSSSSSSDEEEDDDDNNNKGIVEQILNRDQKN